MNYTLVEKEFMRTTHVNKEVDDLESASLVSELRVSRVMLYNQASIEMSGNLILSMIMIENSLNFLTSNE